MIKGLRTILITLFFSNSLINLYAQSMFSGIRYQVGGGAYLSGKTPFWMRANQYGVVPIEGPFLALQAGAFKEYDSTRTDLQKNKKIDIGYGVLANFNVGKQSQALLPEAYIKARLGAFELYVGRRREIVGLVDTTLGSGSFIWSGNAIPLPKVQIAIPNYTSIIGHGLISIKGAYAHGWFGKQQYTEGYYLHQKWLYGKIGRDSWKVNFYGGMNHQVQWGGYSESLKNNNFSTNNGFLSADPFVYLNVIVPVGWSIPNNSGYTPFEMLNRFGNHLGSIDLGVSIKTKGADISFYRQAPYEDGQMPEVFLSMDGNYTLSIDLKDKKHINKISFGYLDTRRQGGTLTKFAKWIGKKETHVGEVQDYFNHGQYREGWTYQGNTIGTPLIIPRQDLLENPQSSTYIPYFIDNRIQAYYLAANGKIKKYNYLLKSSFMESLGLFGLRRGESLKQFSGLASINFPVSKLNLDLKLDISFDAGQLYGNNQGFSFFILKKW